MPLCVKHGNVYGDGSPCNMCEAEKVTASSEDNQQGEQQEESEDEESGEPRQLSSNDASGRRRRKR